jgi:hypothetical protein
MSTRLMVASKIQLTHVDWPCASRLTLTALRGEACSNRHAHHPSCNKNILEEVTLDYGVSLLNGVAIII